MFVRKEIMDVFAEVIAFRICIEKVSILLRWEIEVTINLATLESQIEPSPLNNMSRRFYNLGIDWYPVDRMLHLNRRPITSSNRSCRESGRHNDIPGQQFANSIDR